MAYKALTNGQGADLNVANMGYGYGADTVIILDSSDYNWGVNEIKTYEGNDYIDGSRSTAGGTHCLVPGAGDDYFVGGGAGDAVEDGQGSDTYFLGGSTDILYAGAGNDYVDGGDGADLVYFNRISGDGRAQTTVNYEGVTYDLANQGPQDLGVYGTDTLVNFESIVGSQGADHFYGNDGANTMWAYEGDDVLYGRGGNDTLYGYGGADIIVGGAGADTINVDEEGYQHYTNEPYQHYRDIIRYNSTSDSLPTPTGHDHIYWFESGNSSTSDKIDLSRIDANHFKSGNQAFIFDQGHGRFASSAGEISLKEVYTATGKYTIVHVDTDSDPADEMQIIVHDVVGMTKADFIL